MLPLLLGFMALCVPHLDLYFTSQDEFISLFHAGWIGTEKSPIATLQSLMQYSSNHTPVYFLLLNLWGHWLGDHIMLARLLSAFCVLLSLACAYRLGRDSIAPLAGIFAALLMASNAFLNHHVTLTRPYALSVLLATLVPMLYLRLSRRKAQSPPLAYVALFACACLLLYTHAMNVLLLAAICLHHLFFAPRARDWWGISAALLLAGLLFLPYLPILYSEIERSAAMWAVQTVSAKDGLWDYLSVATNNVKPLLAFPALGILYSLWQRGLRTWLRSGIFTILIYLILLMLLSELFGYVNGRTLRFYLAGLPLFFLLVAAGSYGLYRWHKWLGISILLWALAGTSFQQQPYMAGRHAGMASRYHTSAWHQVSRVARAVAEPTVVIGYRQEQRDIYALGGPAGIPIWQSFSYFSQHDIDFHFVESPASLQQLAPSLAAGRLLLVLNSPSLGDIPALRSSLQAAGYQPYTRSLQGLDTHLLEFRRESPPPQ